MPEGFVTWSVMIAIVFVMLFLIGLIVHIKQKKRYDLAKITLKDIDQMTGFEFEEYLYVLFVALEYEETYLTKKSGDFGADLLFVDDEERKTVVQAKRLTDKLGLSAVQEVYAAKAYYGAERAIIITSTEDISSSCLKLASATEVTIIDRDELDEIITFFKRDKFEHARKQIEEPQEPMNYNPSTSLEVIQQKRGIIQAGEFYYKY